MALEWDDWADRLKTAAPALRQGLERLTDRLIQFVLTVLLMGALYAGILYFCRGFWLVYVETPVGMHYIADHAETARLLTQALSFPPAALASRLAVHISSLALGWGALCRLTFVLRYGFEGQGLLLRSLLAGVPLTVLTAGPLAAAEQIELSAALGLTLLPSLLLVHPCLGLVCRYVPEPDDLYRWGKALWKQVSSSPRPRKD